MRTDVIVAVFSLHTKLRQRRLLTIFAALGFQLQSVASGAPKQPIPSGFRHIVNASLPENFLSAQIDANGKSYSSKLLRCTACWSMVLEGGLNRHLFSTPSLVESSESRNWPATLGRGNQLKGHLNLSSTRDNAQRTLFEFIANELQLIDVGLESKCEAERTPGSQTQGFAGPLSVIGPSIARGSMEGASPLVAKAVKTQQSP